MDNRSWEAGAAGVAPAVPVVPSVGYPTNGDPVASSPATLPGAWWFHQIGEELRAVLTAAGVVPDASNTAQLLESIERLIDAQSGNYAPDTGAANAYVVALNPAIAAYADGLTVRVKVVNTNTAAATLNAGGGAIPLVNDVGGALVAGDLTAGGIYEVTYIASANKFYVTSLVLSQAASVGGGISQAQADVRYAALAGLATQLFSVAPATAASHAVRLGQFGGSFATNGYITLPGGLIMQWGLTASQANNSMGAVVFPIVFPSAGLYVNYVSTVQPGGANANTNVPAFSTTGFNFWNNQATAATFRWFAVGY